jgi:hypothetical protein
MCYQDHRQHQCTRQGEAACEYGADAPRDPDTRGLASFRPEEVEEEGGAEDGCDVDPGEYVVGECADDVVVLDRGRTADTGAGGLQVALLLDILCSTPERDFG